MEEQIKSLRCDALALFRLWCTLLVFFFHCTLHLQSYFGPFQRVFSQGGIAMTGFFMLSGFLAYYNAVKLEPNQFNVTQYLKKRIVSLFPLYLSVTVIFIVVYQIHWKQFIFLLPIELLMLQSYFPDITGLLHNSGTWFFTSMAVSYFLFPYLLTLIFPLTKKHVIIVGIIVYAICAYSPYVMIKFGAFGIYTNPFFRILEFIIGMLVAYFVNKHNDKYCIGLIIVFAFVVMFLGVTYIDHYTFFHDNYMAFNVLLIPLYALSLFLLSVWKIDCFLLTILKSKIILFVDNLSLSFFMAQLFSFTIMKYIYSSLSNIITISIAFSVNTAIAVVLHLVCEKPLKRNFRSFLRC